MNKLLKLSVGWGVWTVGTLLYAGLTTSAAFPQHGDMTAVEFAYGAMMTTYLIGVPILTGLWIAGEFE